MAPTPSQSQSNLVKTLSGKKQPKARVVRYLKKQGPHLVEPVRSILLLRGIKCPDAMTTLLRDLRSIRAPNAKLLQKNNFISAFENEDDTNSLEFLTTKNDCSLFALASSNKKRPNNLVLGRTYDRRILDMVELGVMYFKSIQDYRGAPNKRLGSKPLLSFDGDLWDLRPDYKRLRNLLIDTFRGEPVTKVALSGIDHIMTFTVVEQPTQGGDARVTVHLRTFNVHLKQPLSSVQPSANGLICPVPYLVPCGPDMDFVLRRSRYAPADVWKEAVKQPRGPTTDPSLKKKKKNINTNVFGETMGRLHLQKQDIDGMGGKKSKALRLAEKIEKQEENEKVEKELEREKQEIDAEFEQTHGFTKSEIE